MTNFLLTIVVRFLGGAVIGCMLSAVLGWHSILNLAAREQFPFGSFILWASIGGLIGVITTPRHDWPWRQK